MRTRPEEPKHFAVGGRKIAVDQLGYLLDPYDWDERVAEELAAIAGVALTPPLWDVIRFMPKHGKDRPIHPTG